MPYPITRFFRTFAADAYPIEPSDELGRAEAQSLTTYYEVGYDDAQRVREFTKHLRQTDPDGNPTWTVAFVERYDYWPSGRLRTRTFIGPDGTIRTWTFGDQPFRWTTHLRKWFECWFGSSEHRVEAPSLSERVTACHELANQIEADLYGDALRRPESVWAYATITERLPDFKAMFELILPGSGPRVSLVGSENPPALVSLPGFDDMLNLGVLEEAWIQLEGRKSRTPVDLLGMVRQNPEVRRWLEANRIAAAFALPIWVRELTHDNQEAARQDAVVSQGAETVAQLVLWFMTRPADAEGAGIVSLFQRLGVFVQSVIHRATERDPIIRNRDISAHG